MVLNEITKPQTWRTSALPVKTAVICFIEMTNGLWVLNDARFVEGCF
jgi:hypothetical protein